MKTIALMALAGLGSAAATSTQADGFAPAPFGFDNAYYYPGGPYRPAPYLVTGWGDDGYGGQRRYWGGPFWVDLRGFNPPYQSYGTWRRRGWKRAR